MKKHNISAAIIALTIVFTSAVPICAREVSAEAAVLIEADSGDIIYEKNAHKRLPMASTTKIMTAVVALENCDGDRVVSIPPAACGVEGSSVYLTAGEKLTMTELIYAMLLESANDAATAIAIETAGSVDAFAAKGITAVDTHTAVVTSLEAGRLFDHFDLAEFMLGLREALALCDDGDILIAKVNDLIGIFDDRCGI